MTGIDRFVAVLDEWLFGLARRSVLALLLILAVYCCIALPGLSSIPVTDRDEALFAQASRQMAVSGDWVEIRFDDQARNKKPVGIYWLQAGVVKLLDGGEHSPIWMHRLPSFLGMAAAVALTFAIARHFLPPPSALVSGLLFASALLPGVEAHLAKTDAVLLAFILMSQFILARLYAGRMPRPWEVAAFWLALGASVLVKGPIGPMVIGLTILSLSLIERSAVWVRPLARLWGLGLFLLLVLPWFVAITWRTGGAFWSDSVGTDLLAKAQQGQEGHGVPPGTHLLLLPLVFWPGASLLIPSFRPKREWLSDPALRFAAAWVTPAWLVFEIVPTKLVHYTLPLLPGLALVVGRLWLDVPMRRGARLAAMVLAALGVVLLAGVAVLAGWKAPAALWFLLPSLAAALALFWPLWMALRADRRLAAAGVLAAMAVALSVGVYPSLGQIEPLWPTEWIAKRAEAADCPRPKVIVAGYGEPSLVFRVGRDAERTDGAGAASALIDKGCVLAVVEGRQLATFAAEAAALGLSPISREQFDGFSLGSGKDILLKVFLRE